MTFESISSVNGSCALKSFISSTSSAFVLVRMMRFRNAFRSPGAGGLPVFSGAFFFFLKVFPERKLRFVGPLPLAPNPGAGPAAAEVVEKANAGRRGRHNEK